MLKLLLRPAMIMIPFFIGLLCPQAHILNDTFHLVPIILVIMIFVSSLQLEFRDLAFRREHLAVVGGNILIGIVPWLFCRIFFPEARELAQLFFFTGIIPAATASPVIVSFLGGNVGFTLTGFVASSFFVSAAMALMMPLVTGNFSFAFLWNVTKTVSLLVIIPILLAFAVQKRWPSARDLPKKYKNSTFALWCVLLFIIASIAGNYLLHNPEISYLSLLLPAAVSGGISIVNFLLGKRLGGKKYRVECGQLLGQKNTSFGIYAALLYANPFVTFGPIFYVLWHNVWNACQLFRYEQKRR